MKYICSNRFIFILLVVFAFFSCEEDAIYLNPFLDFEILLPDSIAPVTVSFINKSSNVDQFEWDFGDGITSHEKSPVHVYNEDGEFTIALKAWSDHEQLFIQKTIYLSKVYQYLITNKSSFILYNLSSFSNDSSQHFGSINHGILNTKESSEKCQIQSKNLYVSFEDVEGRQYKTAFPFHLKDEIVNELIIDKNTLVVVDY